MPNDKSKPKPETVAQQETGGDCVSRLVRVCSDCNGEGGGFIDSVPWGEYAHCKTCDGNGELWDDPTHMLRQSGVFGEVFKTACGLTNDPGKTGATFTPRYVTCPECLSAISSANDKDLARRALDSE